MSRVLKIVLSLTVISFVIYWMNKEIRSYNLDFYYGKDNGFFVQFESICIMSSLFFVIMARTKKLKSLLVGFVTGILTTIISVVIVGLDSTGLYFHIAVCILFMLIYFAYEKYILQRQKQK